MIKMNIKTKSLKAKICKLFKKITKQELKKFIKLKTVMELIKFKKAFIL